MSMLLKRTFVSLPDYFMLDGEDNVRYVYRNGEVFSMGGAQPEHNMDFGNRN